MCTLANSLAVPRERECLLNVFPLVPFGDLNVSTVGFQLFFFHLGSRREGEREGEGEGGRVRRREGGREGGRGWSKGGREREEGREGKREGGHLNGILLTNIGLKRESKMVHVHVCVYM